MRNAKEHAEIYINSTDKNKAIGRIAAAFLQETVDSLIEVAIKAPGSSSIPDSDPRIKKVLVQQNKKWQEFATLIGGAVRTTGYEILLRDRAPHMLSILNGGVSQY